MRERIPVAPPGVKVRIQHRNDVPELNAWFWRCDWHGAHPFTYSGDSLSFVSDGLVRHFRETHRCAVCHTAPITDYTRPARWWEW